MLDLKKDCPGLLNAFRGFPENGEGSFLELLVNNTLKIKTNTITQLGLVDGRLDLSSAENALSGLYRSLRLMTLLSPADISVEDISNNIYKGEKLSRKICKQYAGMTEKNWDTYPNMFQLAKWLLATNKDEIKKELPAFNYNTMSLFNNINRVLGEHADIVTIENFIPLFVQNFYSELSAKIKCVHRFSVNPLDILNAANSTSFTSCYRIGGGYEKSTFIVNSIINSGVIMSVNANGTCVGRAWVFFTPDLTAFAMPKSYGVLTDDTIDAVISAIISKTPHATKKWTKAVGSTHFREVLAPVYSDDNSYFDNICTMFTCNPQVRINPAETAVHCIKCGKLNTSTTAICNTCTTSMRRCRNCNAQIWAADSAVTLCNKCASLYITCMICGHTYEKNKKACPVCTKKSSCIFCGETNNLRPFEEYSACSSCIAAVTASKCVCCKKEDQTYPFGKHAVCRDCFHKLNRARINPQISVTELQKIL